MDAKQTRREFKFLLPEKSADSVRSMVDEHFAMDGHAPANYHIVSDYFDSDDYSTYWQKVLGYRNRQRVRLRKYHQGPNDAQPAYFMEIKHREAGLTTKLRMPVDPGSTTRLLQGELPHFEGVEGVRFRKMLQQVIQTPQWQPRIRIGYQRTAYDDPDDAKLRVTFDCAVRCCFPNYAAGDDPEPSRAVINPEHQIMEVKAVGAVPYWFRNLIGRFSLAPVSMSKYSIAMERFHFKRPPEPTPS